VPFGIDPIRHPIPGAETESTPAITGRRRRISGGIGRRGRLERRRHRPRIQRVDAEQPAVTRLGSERDPADHEERRRGNDGDLAPPRWLVDGLIEGRGKPPVRPHEAATVQSVHLSIAAGELKPRLHPAETRIQRTSVGGALLDGTKIDPLDVHRDRRGR
jgi:hypothetical protein